MYILEDDGITDYRFENIEDAIKAIARWNDNGSSNEKTNARFIIQLFHQIPESVYNDIVDIS